MEVITLNVTIAVKATMMAMVGLCAAGCSPQEKYPEAYGLYAWNGTTWIAIAKSKATIELDLPADTKFLIHDKAIDRVSKSFRLIPEIFIRNVISQSPEGQMQGSQAFNKWNPKASEQIDGRFSPVKNQAEMVTWAPSGKLATGVYVSDFEGMYQEAFTVHRQLALTNIELGDSCYDQIKTTAWGLPMGLPDGFKPCAGDPTEQLVQLMRKAAEAKMFRRTPVEVDIARVEKLIANGANVNDTNNGALPPVLVRAIDLKRQDLVSLFLNKGANVNARIALDGDSNDTETALFRAASVGGIQIVKLLAEKGADINARGFANSTVLFSAGEPEVIEYFVSKGVDINAKNTRGHTALADAEERRDYQAKSIKEYQEIIDSKPKDPGHLFENFANTKEALKSTEILIETLRKHGATK